MSFDGSVTFLRNSGSGLSVAKSEVNFSNCSARFVQNIGSKGGGIALLGAARIIIGNDTQMHFVNNTAMIYGGAIYNNYISKRILGSYPDCFIQFADPFIRARDWGATFNFEDNADLGGSHPNAIHSTSIMPCAWVGEDLTNIFTWNGWSCSNKSIVLNCSTLVSSNIAKIELKTETKDKYTVFPGLPFSLDLDVRDDLDLDITKRTVFLASVNASQFKADLENRKKYSYLLGGNATIWGEDRNTTDVTLTLNTIEDPTWHLEISVILKPCPPGFRESDSAQDSSNVTNENATRQLRSCECADSYGGVLYCDKQLLTARLDNGLWMGKLNISNKEYYLHIALMDSAIKIPKTLPSHFHLMPMILNTVHVTIRVEWVFYVLSVLKDLCLPSIHECLSALIAQIQILLRMFSNTFQLCTFLSL